MLAVSGGRAAATCDFPAIAGLDLGCSATLVHPEVVLYAAHCGEGIRGVTFGEDLDRPERVLETSRCEAHPEAALGNGFDVAFCLLAQPVDDVPPLPIAAGCELGAIEAGMTATLVGYGPDEASGRFGLKRSLDVTLGAIAQDLVATAEAGASCPGDSGGPLVLDLAPALGSLEPAARVIGVLSAANSAECGQGVDHYSFVPDLLPWLEDASGRDLTPCFDDDDRWAPTPACVEASLPEAPVSWNRGCRSPAAGRAATSCGPAFDVERLLDTVPPELELIVPELPEVVDDDDTFDTWIEASASDDESGVSGVRFELLDEAGGLRAEQRDEVPPYRLDALSLPAGFWTMVVSARDHAGNERRAEHTFRVAASAVEGGCSFARAAHSGASALGWLLVVAALGYRRRASGAITSR